METAIHSSCCSKHFKEKYIAFFCTYVSAFKILIIQHQFLLCHSINTKQTYWFSKLHMVLFHLATHPRYTCNPIHTYSFLLHSYSMHEYHNFVDSPLHESFSTNFPDTENFVSIVLNNFAQIMGEFGIYIASVD